MDMHCDMEPCSDLLQGTVYRRLRVTIAYCNVVEHAQLDDKNTSFGLCR